MTANEIYHEIEKSLLDYIPGDWSKAVLEINRKDGVSGYFGIYTTKKGENKGIDVWEYSLDDDMIHELHAVTTEDGQNRWNKLKFTLLAEGKFEVDFIWDQEYQDEVANLNKQK